MQIKITICVFFFFFGAGLSNTGLAQDKKTADGEIEKLRKQFTEMQLQIKELKMLHTVEIEDIKKQHRAELQLLKKQIASLGPREPKGRAGETEAEYLRRLAEIITKEEATEVKPEEETVFTSGGLSLQALNPEISVTGDMLGYLTIIRIHLQRGLIQLAGIFCFMHYWDWLLP